MTTAADDSVFVIRASALAGPRNSIPDGLRYHILAFAKGTDEAGALEAAGAGLQARGWDAPEILSVGEITDPGGIPEDMRAAYAGALERGCALIIYDEA